MLFFLEIKTNEVTEKDIAVDSKHKKTISIREEVLTTGLDALDISQMSKQSKTTSCM